MAVYPKNCGSGDDMKVDGKVGINGVSNPSAKLQIAGTTDVIRLANVGVTNNPHFWLTQNAYYDGSWNRMTSSRKCAGMNFHDTDGDIAFLTDSSTSGTPSLSTVVKILNSGAVGIGTENPASKLEVDGGDVEVDDSSKGVILRSPDGTRWRVKVDNSGNLTTSSL